MTVRTVIGRGRLTPDLGPILVSVGVFDGLHLGHAWLIDRLVHEARLRDVRPAVVWIHGGALLMGNRAGFPRNLLNLCSSEGFALVSIVPAQLHALHLTRARGLDPETPRNLAKVTRTT